MSLSSSARVAGLTATCSAGGGKRGRGNVTGWPLGASVSPVRVPFSRGMATKSPATTDVGRRGGVPERVCSSVQALLLRGCGC
jgi:hypothetical protein